MMMRGTPRLASSAEAGRLADARDSLSGWTILNTIPIIQSAPCDVKREEMRPVLLRAMAGRPICRGMTRHALQSLRLTFAYARTCPSPRTTHLYVVSSRSAIGPRACSRCVLIATSAPIPNWPPAQQDVDQNPRRCLAGDIGGAIGYYSP